MSDSTASSRSFNPLALSIGSRLGPVRDAIALWWRIRRDERFLLGQPEYLLRDIGINRSDIAEAVRNRLHP